MKYLVILLLVLSSLSLGAQTPGQDSLQERYHQILHPSDALMNGREYKFYFTPRGSSPLIPQDPLPSASVLTREKGYQNVHLLYDTYKDLLLYHNPATLFNGMLITVIVNSNLIEEFTLQLPSGQARFRYLNFPENQEGLLSSGYYEVVSEGTCMYIIDHYSLKETQAGGVGYSYKTQGYLILSGTAFKIMGKKSLLKALSDQPAKVNEYLKREKIRVRRASKEQLKGLLEHYMKK